MPLYVAIVIFWKKVVIGRKLFWKSNFWMIIDNTVTKDGLLLGLDLVYNTSRELHSILLGFSRDKLYT